MQKVVWLQIETNLLIIKGTTFSSHSLFPLVETSETLNEIGHGLISTTRLLLIVARLLWFALSTSKETVLETSLHVLLSSPVRSLRVHARFFSLTLLPLQLCRQEIVTLHLYDLFTCYLTVYQFCTHMRILQQDWHYWSELIFSHLWMFVLFAHGFLKVNTNFNCLH